MRVKKLNTNRRAKAGDDDAASTGSAGDSEPHTSSPTKWKDIDSPDPHNSSSSTRRVDTVEFGADSPTDPSAALPPHDVVVSELELNRQTAYAAASMANLIATAHATANAANGNATTTAIAATTATTSTTTSSSTESTTAASSSSWRDRVDATLRESVHTKIVEYLKTLKPNAPAKVMDKLPGLAFRMEDALFKVAASEQEYADQSTLPQRLTLIQQANAKRLLQQQWPVVSPKDKDASSRKPLNEAQARVVFSCLQSWRQKLVNMYSAVPWEILPNQILAKVAVFVPSTTQELVVCGVPNEQLERFGNSLLQEIEKILNALNANATAAAAQQLQAAMIQQAARSMSPSATKRPAPASGKGSSANKSSSSTKKRKTGAESTATSNTNAPTPAVRLAAAPAATFLSAASFLSQAPSLIRPIDPAFIAAATSAAAAAAGTSSLPALLPSGPLPSAASGSAAARTASFFPRIPVPDQQSENRMHLLAQGVGQLSQQQEQQQNLERSVDAYEKEIQTLRWMLQESQREKALLEQEVLRLRQQGAK